MDRRTEQKIRDRAYELWMQNGCLPDRADEYWFQAEQEILGATGSQPSEEDREIASEVSSYPVVDQNDAPLETSSAPLGMTSETADEFLPASDDVLPNPVAAKTRKRRGVTQTEAGDVTGPTGGGAQTQAARSHALRLGGPRASDRAARGNAAGTRTPLKSIQAGEPAAGFSVYFAGGGCLS